MDATEIRAGRVVRHHEALKLSARCAGDEWRTVGSLFERIGFAESKVEIEVGSVNRPAGRYPP